MERRAPLHVVPAVRLPASREGAEGSDLGLLVFLLAVNLIPLGGMLAGGRWGEGSLGFGTLVSILCARELVHELRARRDAPQR